MRLGQTDAQRSRIRYSIVCRERRGLDLPAKASIRLSENMTAAYTDRHLSLLSKESFSRLPFCPM